MLDPKIGELAISAYPSSLPLSIESSKSEMYLNFISNDVNSGTPRGFNASITTGMRF